MKNFFKFLFGVIALAFIGALTLLTIIIYVSYDLPQLNSLADYSPSIPSKIYSKDGHLLMELSKEKREVIPIEEIPQNIIDTFLAAEDDNFYNHSGIDYWGIARAMLTNIREGKIKQGASTITQQVAKSLLLSNERTFTRKIKDMILAKKIEEKLEKNEILFLYLNQVYLGGGYYGVKAAFRGYFDKELSEATVAECALVAGLLVAPGRYSPYINPKRAKSRQTYVLGRLRATEKITEEVYQAALNEDIKIHIRKPANIKAGHFTDWIRQRLNAQFGTEEVLTGGYEVVTTINWELQKKAEAEVIKGIKELDKRQGFKGPLRSLTTDKEIHAFLLKQREEIYKDHSAFLVFKTDGTSEREFSMGENEYQELLEFEELELKKYMGRGKSFLQIGNKPDESVFEMLDYDEPVTAVVTRVSNSQRIIYANYAGIKLIIPHEGFKWAHERVLSEDVKYWSYNNYPETIVKKGDVILVSLSNKKTRAWGYIDQDFKKRYKSAENLLTIIKEQKYLLASLDQEPDAEGALLSVSPQSGEILAMVGGVSFTKSQFNRVIQSNRQPGSAFKPLLYAVGLENQYTPATMLLDSPQALGGVDDRLSWKPRNYDGKFKGEMTFRRALETSRNIPTIKLTQDIGVEKIINFVKRLGIDADLPNDLSVSLGSFGMNLMDLVRIYSIFPNGGRKINLKSIISIKDRYGNSHAEDAGNSEVSETEPLEKKEEVEVPEKLSEEEKEDINPYLVNLNDTQVYDERLAYLMSNILKGVIQNGTGRSTASISPYIGGKTGTTNNYVDAWFLGFSPRVVTGVWTGFDNNKTLGWPETGAKAALPIWKAFMKKGLSIVGETDFRVPRGIVNVAINPKTGRLADGGERYIESFVEGTEPGVEKLEGTEENNSATSIYESENYYLDE